MNTTASLHRSQFSENFDLKDYLIDSGSGSRIRPCDGGADSAAFSEREFSNGLSRVALRSREGRTFGCYAKPCQHPDLRRG